MRTDTLGNWPEQLQPAVLASNTTLKVATGFTPFYLMFGRESDVDNLLKLAKHSKYIETNCDTDTQEAETSIDTTTQDGANSREQTAQEDPYKLVSDPNEWVYDHKNERRDTVEIAKKRIEKEQFRQKSIYDKKVKMNRYC